MKLTTFLACKLLNSPRLWVRWLFCSYALLLHSSHFAIHPGEGVKLPDILLGCCQGLGLRHLSNLWLLNTVLLIIELLYRHRIYGRKSKSVFLACSMIFFLFSFHSEAKQWESLTAECRRLLVESLATMETDNRPELQEKASVLKKTLESLEWMRIGRNKQVPCSFEFGSLKMVIFFKNQVGGSKDYSVACIIPWLK